MNNNKEQRKTNKKAMKYFMSLPLGDRMIFRNVLKTQNDSKDFFYEKDILDSIKNNFTAQNIQDCIDTIKESEQMIQTATHQHEEHITYDETAEPSHATHQRTLVLTLPQNIEASRIIIIGHDVTSTDKTILLAQEPPTDYLPVEPEMVAMSLYNYADAVRAEQNKINEYDI